MAGVPDKIQTWQMTQPTSRDKETKEVTPGKIEKTEIDVPELKEGDVLVEVAGCGVCHTDLGYYYDGVPTVVKPPLTLGHEISGTVVAGERCRDARSAAPLRARHRGDHAGLYPAARLGGRPPRRRRPRVAARAGR